MRVVQSVRCVGDEEGEVKGQGEVDKGFPRMTEVFLRMRHTATTELEPTAPAWQGRRAPPLFLAAA